MNKGQVVTLAIFCVAVGFLLSLSAQRMLADARGERHDKGQCSLLDPSFFKSECIEPALAPEPHIHAEPIAGGPPPQGSGSRWTPFE